MNASATSVGGWPATTLKKYLDEVFIYKLPEELQKVIISTKTISGHGKKFNGTNTYWWLRTANASYIYGLAPTFRIR